MPASLHLFSISVQIGTNLSSIWNLKPTDRKIDIWVQFKSLFYYLNYTTRTLTFLDWSVQKQNLLSSQSGRISLVPLCVSYFFLLYQNCCIFSCNFTAQDHLRSVWNRLVVLKTNILDWGWLVKCNHHPYLLEYIKELMGLFKAWYNLVSCRLRFMG